ncbi:MAG: BON domain-containing protein [Nitrospinae bacterium]|nr:BON domain-containing protein [Nitrospinota bacterium]
MSKFTRFILVISFLPLWVNGCVPAAVMVAQKGIKSAFEDRSLKQQVEDTKIHANLLQEYLRVDSGLPVDVNTDVWEGRVLLTGLVDAEKKREAVLSIARGDPRIKAVYDHILLGSPDEVERNREVAKTQPAVERDIVKLSRIASDAWIEAKLKTQFLTTEGVNSVNYRWQSIRNKVYIIGRARTEVEKKLVLQIIRGTKGVIHIEEYIQVKPVQK